MSIEDYNTRLFYISVLLGNREGRVADLQGWGVILKVGG